MCRMCFCKFVYNMVISWLLAPPRMPTSPGSPDCFFPTFRGSRSKPSLAIITGKGDKPTDIANICFLCVFRPGDLMNEWSGNVSPNETSCFALSSCYSLSEPIEQWSNKNTLVGCGVVWGLLKTGGVAFGGRVGRSVLMRKLTRCHSAVWGGWAYVGQVTSTNQLVGCHVGS